MVNDRDYFALTGGLNSEATPLQLKPGELIGGVNYECNSLGGYRRFKGYERFDGHTAPSAAPYYLISFGSGVPASYPVPGNTVTGATSAATGIVLLAPVLDGTGLAGTLVMARVSGTFVSGENLSVGASVFGASTSAVSSNSAPTDIQDTTYFLAASADARTLINAVPGSGPIRGVVEYNGIAYAFRDNVGATAIGMYKETAAGWTQVPAFPILYFAAGLSLINEGDTITGVTSTNTAIVRRVVLQSGVWGSTAAGFLVLASGSPAFVNAETIQVGATNCATTVGTAVAPTILPRGTFEFRVHNFYGNTKTTRLCMVDGKNCAYEYQDSPEFLCPILTGTPVDVPIHLAAHRGRLWLAFQGGSIQPSSVNDPAVYSALTGAAELSIGEEVTGFLEEQNPSQNTYYSTATLFIMGAVSTHTLTGDGPNWILGPFATEVGSNPFTIQRLGQGIFLNARGFSSLLAAQSYGNFKMSSFSNKIDSLMTEIRARAVCSSVSKERSLYRLFMNDGRFVSIGFRDNKVIGMTLCDLSQAMSCAWSGQRTDGTEFLLAGGTNGYVYRLDSGNNIDGAQIVAFLRMPFNFSRSPTRQKRYRRAAFDVKAEGNCTLQFAPEYSFAAANVGSDPPRTLALVGGGGFWDVSNWDHFKWDTAASANPSIKLEGSGTNIGFLVAHLSTNEPPHTIQGISLQWSIRRLDRTASA